MSLEALPHVRFASSRDVAAGLILLALAVCGWCSRCPLHETKTAQSRFARDDKGFAATIEDRSLTIESPYNAAGLCDYHNISISFHVMSNPIDTANAAVPCRGVHRITYPYTPCVGATVTLQGYSVAVFCSLLFSRVLMGSLPRSQDETEREQLIFALEAKLTELHVNDAARALGVSHVQPASIKALSSYEDTRVSEEIFELADKLVRVSSQNARGYWESRSRSPRSTAKRQE